MAALIDLTQLRTFVAVAEEQHLTRAAERIHISQSAASAHVRAVEDLLNTQLFTRTNRSLVLTGAGELLFVKAKELLNEAAQFTSFARELSGKLEGTLSISVSSDPIGSRIGDILAKLHAHHPLITLDVRARPSAGIRQGIKSGELDLGIFLDKPMDANLAYYRLSNVDFCVAGPSAWKETIEKASLFELSRLPWLTPADNSMAYSNMLNELFQSNGYELNSVATFDNAVVARTLVEAGLGLMLMRKEHALQGVQQGKYAVSPIATGSYDFLIAHLKSRSSDPLILASLEAVKTVWPDYNLI
jgi:DNA-binding transcriptional LysR family regulator